MSNEELCAMTDEVIANAEKELQRLSLNQSDVVAVTKTFRLS